MAPGYQAPARVAHPNIVIVHDVGVVDERVFVAMEFVRGQTLRGWQRARERSWREILTVYRAAGQGLAAAHPAGLIHRDFKPDNAMIGDDGRVRVMDFGLAAERGASESVRAPDERARLLALLSALKQPGDASPGGRVVDHQSSRCATNASRRPTMSTPGRWARGVEGEFAEFARPKPIVRPT